MDSTDAICPTCGSDITKREESEGFITFYTSPLNQSGRAEGHFECPACGGDIYIDADLREVSRG